MNSPDMIGYWQTKISAGSVATTSGFFLDFRLTALHHDSYRERVLRQPILLFFIKSF
ncbi:MAG: hypothetical protein ABI290_04955 [Ginsengibacter sp.]